jgi:hypothetical protein
MLAPTDNITAEHALVADMASLTHDPLGHARYSYPWGRGVLTGISGPRRWQAEQLDRIGRHLRNPETRFTPYREAIASGHGIGKSADIGMVVNWALDTCDDCRIVFTANTEGQLRTKTMPEIGKWRGLSVAKHWFKPTATALISTATGRASSWRADATPWSENNTEAFAGLHNKGKRIVLIFDEASKIAPKVWEVAEGALTDEGTEIIWLAFGNPTQASGRFRECFGRDRARWHTSQIDSRTVEGVNRAYLDELVSTYGEDSDIVRVRVRGLFPNAASMQFIAQDAVDGARQREASSIASDALVMGVDVARFGDDNSTIYFRKGRNARIRNPERHSGLDTMQLAGRVAELQRESRADMVFVDEGGIGAGVVDRLRQLGAPVVGIQFGGKPLGAVALGEGVKVANRRAEMWAIMRQWLPGGAIPDDQKLADDLTGLEYGYDKNDAILLEKKEHMKARGLASPDDGDGLALTFAMPVVKSVGATSWHGGSSGGGISSEYDPYAS